MAVPTYTPPNVLLSDAKTGYIPYSTEEITLDAIQQNSAYMQLARAETMTTLQKKFYYMTGIGAYWVSETERIQTSKPTWQEAEMKAHKLGVIIPASREFLTYTVSDFFAQMQPRVAEAFYKKFDQAALYGLDNPYTQSIVNSATTAGQVVTAGANKYDDLNEAMGMIEQHDLSPTGIAARRTQMQVYRGTKDTTGLPIFNAPTAGAPGTLLGLPLSYVPQGSADPASEVTEFIGDWQYARYGILQGIRYEILTEATLTTVAASDASGAPVSLAERDMMALKATMMVGMIVLKDEAFSVIETPATP